MNINLTNSNCIAPNDEYILYRCAEVESCKECPYNKQLNLNK